VYIYRKSGRGIGWRALSLWQEFLLVHLLFLKHFFVSSVCDLKTSHTTHHCLVLVREHELYRRRSNSWITLIIRITITITVIIIIIIIITTTMLFLPIHKHDAPKKRLDNHDMTLDDAIKLRKADRKRRQQQQQQQQQ
jgi:hypothetical protein